MVGVSHQGQHGSPAIDVSVTFDAAFPASVLGDAAKELSGKPLSAAPPSPVFGAFVLRALGDEDGKVRDTCLAAAVLADAAALLPVLEHYLETDGDGEADADRADRTAAGISLVMGGIAKRSGSAEMAKKVR